MKRIISLMIMIAIAAIVMGTANAQNQIKLGPSGGYGGGGFLDSVPVGAGAAEVQIRSGAYVDSLQMVIQLPNGQLEYLDKHGGDGGGANTFSMRDGEYIIGISGKYGDYVDSIRFRTNLRTSPTYGGSGGGQAYNYQAPPGWQIVGFYGRSGAYIDAIGVLLGKL